VNDWAICVKDLIKIYPGRDGPVHAVNGLDLEVPRGECFGLLGPNGAGKTTTVEILEGLTPPTSGDVEVLGRRWPNDPQAIRERIGVTLQETKFPDKATVSETVELFRSFYRAGAGTDEVLAKVALEPKANAFVETLSGGQQRRLAVALALVGEPELIFLDEPTTGLDPQSRLQLQDVIRDLRTQGRTTLLTTHYMDEAEKLCDRVAIVDRGRVIALGSPRELISQNCGDHVLEFQLEENGSTPDPASFRSVAGVHNAARDGPIYRLSVTEPHRVLPAFLARVEADGLALSTLSTRHGTLEDVFVQLTGRHLRDGEEPDAESGEQRGRGRGRRGRRRAG
jgi:ABC-2 type transport system ATP-binding protein